MGDISEKGPVDGLSLDECADCFMKCLGITPESPGYEGKREDAKTLLSRGREIAAREED